jgi:hypothetical protein
VLKHFEIEVASDLSPQALADEYTIQLDYFILTLGSVAHGNTLEGTSKNQSKKQGVAYE